MQSEDKIEVDLKKKQTEQGWIRIFDRFGLTGAPIWFGWLGWILALGAFQYMHLRTQSIIIAIFIVISYAMLWFYFCGFLFRIEFKGIPFINSPRSRQVASILLSGLLAAVSWRLAILVANAIAEIQTRP